MMDAGAPMVGLGLIILLAVLLVGGAMVGLFVVLMLSGKGKDERRND
jgi:hypothetical protein